MQMLLVVLRNPFFVPSWTLTSDSHFGDDRNCIEFALHAYPPQALAEVSATSHAEASQTLRVFSAQTAVLLADVANRLDSLAPLQGRDAGLRRALQESASLNGELQGKVVDLEGRIRILESQVGVVEKAKKVVDEKVVTLEGTLLAAKEELVERREENHLLRTDVERLEGEVMRQNQLLLDQEAQLAPVKDQLKWVLEEGVAAAVDRVLDSTTFSGALQRFGRICHESGEVTGRETLRNQLGLHAPSTAEPAIDVQQALEDMAQIDFVAMLRLRGLTFAGLQDFCQGSSGPSSAGLT